MPRRAPRICSCGKVVPSGVTCPCQAGRRRETNRRHDRKRGTSSQRGYTGKWDRESRAFLRRWPFCNRCGVELDLDHPRAAVVDHIKPHRGDQTLFWDRANWQRLCTSCHSGAKQREERRAKERTEP